MNNPTNDTKLMNGLFDAPKKLKGLSIAQVVGADADEGDEQPAMEIQRPDWFKNVKGTRLDPHKLALVANVFGYTLNQSPSTSHFRSGFLLTVIPPHSLKSKSNSPQQPRRGLLMPLESSLPAMRASIAREFNLPSSGGIIVYLIEEYRQQDSQETIDEPGPRINDESWRLLWRSYLRSPSTKERMPDEIPKQEEGDGNDKSLPSVTPSLRVPTPHQSIAGKIEFDIDTQSKAGNWYNTWQGTAVSHPVSDGKRKFRLRSDTTNTQEIPYNNDDSSQVPTPAALSASAKSRFDTNNKNDSPRSTSSLPYRTFELETLQSLLQPSAQSPSHSGAGSPRLSGIHQPGNRGSVHVMQDTLDELEKALADLSPRPIDQHQDFGQRRDAVHKAARTLSKIGNREGFHMPRKDDGTLKSFEEITEEDENNFEQHGTANTTKSDINNDLVGSLEGYRKDDEPVDIPKSPSRSTESRSNSLSNSDDSNQNDRLTETPATETDMSRYTPPPKPPSKPLLSIETNNHLQNPQLSISPSSPGAAMPRTAPPHSNEMAPPTAPSPPRSGNSLPKTPSDEKRSTKTSFSFGSRRKESIQIDRKNSTESKRSTTSKESSGLEGLGIRGLKFWSSSKNTSNANQGQQPQRQREPSITMPIGVVKTASGGPGRLTQTYSHQPPVSPNPQLVGSGAASMRSASPTHSSNHDHSAAGHSTGGVAGAGTNTSATTSMIEHFPDSRYPKDLELGDGKHMVPLKAHSVRQNSVESIHTHRTQSSTSTTSSSRARGFQPRKQSLDYSTLPNANTLASTSTPPHSHPHPYSHSSPLPHAATFAPPEPIPENLEEMKKDAEADAAEEQKINDILAKEREKDFEAKVEAFEQEQLASQARAKALTHQQETRKAIQKEEEQEPELKSVKKGLPGSRFSASPPPSPPRKLPAVPVFSRRR
ncbi:hypothetical protein E3P99_01401 [Wallemia hederae]|uniref:Uncharacterized protein n=1 Tax=Wallemia hederae TaxID=1540922 RepID=A0A4T0FQR3_9BASI|nr:hypothetical protein E3P99_01401 [Wallemia hederae]